MTLHIANVSSAASGVGEAEAAATRRMDQAAESARDGGFEARLDGGPQAGGAVNMSNGPATSPLDTMAGGVMESLEGVARRRSEMFEAQTAASPEELLATARDQLAPGPADLRPRGETGPASTPPPEHMTTDEAIAALGQTFDYAIETHVVVKSVSQFSNTANSLLKAQ